MSSEMTDYIFSQKVLVFVEAYQDEYDKFIEAISDLNSYADNSYRVAFLEGAKNYVADRCGVPYEVNKELSLEELTYQPGVLSLVDNSEMDNLMYKAKTAWLEYNIVSLGVAIL